LFSDDITQSDNDQAVNYPIGGQTHGNHLIAGAFDVREQLHELQSSAQPDASTMVLSLSGSSRLNNGERGKCFTHALVFPTRTVSS